MPMTLQFSGPKFMSQWQHREHFPKVFGLLRMDHRLLGTNPETAKRGLFPDIHHTPGTYCTGPMSLTERAIWDHSFRYPVPSASVPNGLKPIPNLISHSALPYAAKQMSELRVLHRLSFDAVDKSLAMLC